MVVITGSGSKPPAASLSKAPTLPEAELGSLMAIAPNWKDEFGVPPELVAHAIREAKESRLFRGESPETWSPLGTATDYAEVGRWEAEEALVAGLVRSQSPDRDQTPTASFRIDPTSQVRSLEVADQLVAAFVFDSNAFVVPVPESMDELVIDVVDEPAAERMWSQLEAALPTGDRQTVVLWRVYSGDNSWVRDVVSRARDGVHRLTLRGLEGAAFVVGRAMRVVNERLTKTLRDPIMQRRLVWAEARNSKTCAACPRLADLASPAMGAVVVVHGTMSTAVPLAAAVHANIGDSQRCLRYEHDTWLPLEANALELAALITEHIRGVVVLIAHSRGGLVAARAAQILGAANAVRVAGLLTLGTPFAGTPLALAARTGSLGMTTLMGGLRFLGGPVVDAATRIAGFVLRVDPPPGLMVMEPMSDALPILRQYLPHPAATIASTADASRDRYGAALLTGVGRGAFQDQPSDLVVSTASALVGDADHILVACDHFAYAEEEADGEAMRAAVSRLPHPKPKRDPEDKTLSR